AMSIASPRPASTRSASSLAALTEASSISSARIAVSARMVTTCGCTSRMPPPMAKSRTLPSGWVTTTLPGLSRVISGAWRGAMPSSPISPVATTRVASPWKISASALTMSQRMVDIVSSLRSETGFGIRESGFATAHAALDPRRPQTGARFSESLIPNSESREDFRLRGNLLRLLDRLVDAADHVERLLGQVVVLAFDDTLEAADGFLERDILARRTGEHLGHVERLREEALDLARAGHGQLVLFAQFVHAQDRDDVLELLVLLQRGLHPARGVVVLVANHVRVELARGGVERIDRRVDTQRGDVAREPDGRVEAGERGRRRRVG